jgi:DNA-directed RNA polymerase subunit RPC12/RpoP
MSFAPLVIVLGIVGLILFFVIQSRIEPIIRCTNCGYEGKAKKFVKGSLAVEIVLWLLIIVPGLIYSVWRLSTKYWGCPKCEWRNVVKIKP